MSVCLLSSRLSGANSFPAGNLHDVPGASFECGIAPLRTISALTRDFHFRLQPYNSTSCSDRKMSQENTQKEQNRSVEKKVYLLCSSCRLRQTLCVYFTFEVQGAVCCNFLACHKRRVYRQHGFHQNNKARKCHNNDGIPCCIQPHRP